MNAPTINYLYSKGQLTKNFLAILGIFHETDQNCGLIKDRKAFNLTEDLYGVCVGQLVLGQLWMGGQTFSSKLMAPFHGLDQLTAHVVCYDQLIPSAGQNQLGNCLLATIF
jgi:hypothetical protein